MRVNESIFFASLSKAFSLLRFCVDFSCFPANDGSNSTDNLPDSNLLYHIFGIIHEENISFFIIIRLEFGANLRHIMAQQGTTGHVGAHHIPSRDTTPRTRYSARRSFLFTLVSPAYAGLIDRRMMYSSVTPGWTVLTTRHASVITR